MIKRLERTPAGLTIETRRGWSRKQLLGYLLIPVLVTIVVAAGILLLSHFDPRPPGERVSDLGAIAAPAVFLVVMLIMLLCMSGERERLSAHGTKVVYERFVGPSRVAHETFDLLAMRGMRSPALTHVVLPDGSPLTPPLPEDYITLGSSPQPGDQYPLMQGLVFHYKDDVMSLGRTLALSEYGEVAQVLLDYEAAVRASLGMDDGHGLRDQSVWRDWANSLLGPEVQHWSRRRRII